MDVELYFNYSVGSVDKNIWGDLQKGACSSSLKIWFAKHNFQTSSQYKSLWNSGDLFRASGKGLTDERLDSLTG